MKTGALCLTLCAAACLLQTPAAVGCMCVKSPDVPAALGRADAVFAGVIVGKQDAAAENAMLSSMDPIAYFFDVTDVWKGAVGDTAVVTTARHSASCGYPFELGRSYIVYATYSRTVEGELRTNLCTRTHPTDLPENDAEALNAIDTSTSDGDLNRRLIDRSIERLHALEESTRIAAAGELLDMRRDPDRVLPELTDYYRTGTPADRVAAINTIGRLAWQEEFADAAFPVLIEALDDEHPPVVRAAVFTLSRMKEYAEAFAPHVVALMQHEDEGVRQSATGALRFMMRVGFTPEATSDAVKKQLDDPSPAVRATALGLLSDAAPDSVAFEHALSALTTDGSLRVRKTAVHVLGSLDCTSEDAVDALIEALADTHQELAMSAARAVGMIGGPAARALPGLEALAEEEYPPARKTAIEAIATIGEESEAGFRALRRLLEHEDPEIRTNALARLPMMDLPPDTLLPHIETALDDTNRSVRARATATLYHFPGGDERIEALILRMMHDPTPVVRAVAVHQAWRSEPVTDELRIALNRMLLDKSPRVAEAAERGLRILAARERAAQEPAPEQNGGDR